MELVRHLTDPPNTKEVQKLTACSVVVSVFAIVILSIIGGLFKVYTPVQYTSSILLDPNHISCNLTCSFPLHVGRTPLDGRLEGGPSRRQSGRRIGVRRRYRICRVPRLLRLARGIAYEAEQQRRYKSELRRGSEQVLWRTSIIRMYT